MAVALVEEWNLYQSIRAQAVMDESRPAGAIVVLGAAEYNGLPSPVLKARLDHTFDLEERHLAPYVITTGGGGGDAHYTEGGVGRDYLIQRGVAAQKILSENQGGSTYSSVQAVAAILSRLHTRSCIVVSDGFHLYRLKIMLAKLGIRAYGSPVPGSTIEEDPLLRTVYSLREMLLLNLWYLGYKG